jgi:hypothetical protein
MSYTGLAAGKPNKHRQCNFRLAIDQQAGRNQPVAPDFSLCIKRKFKVSPGVAMIVAEMVRDAPKGGPIAIRAASVYRYSKRLLDLYRRWQQSCQHGADNRVVSTGANKSEA